MKHTSWLPRVRKAPAAAVAAMAMSGREWFISLYVVFLCFATYKLTLEVKYLREDGVTLRNAPWRVLQPAVNLWQRPRAAKAQQNVTGDAEAPAVLPQSAAPGADSDTCSCKVSHKRSACACGRLLRYECRAVA